MMKTLVITIATAATLMATAALATSTSSSDGDVRVFNPNQQTLFGGREATARYIIAGGEKSIVSKTSGSSDR